jgi:hypothetical protein
MSRLLHKHGFKIMHGDQTMIHIENRKGGMIEFDIVVPAEKGIVYACRFMRSMEIATASAMIGKKVSINTSHYLLGHRNEDQF